MRALLLLFLGLLLSSVAQAGVDAGRLYQKHCAECHGKDRLGGMGQALLPGNLKRLKKEKAVTVIRDGLPATQMPALGDRLDETAIRALVDYIYTPLPYIPEWGLARMRDTHVVPHPFQSLPDKPVFDADPLNLFVVVELGDHHATILDGDRFEPLIRFKTRRNLHGGPKYSPTGRYVYFASRDGWISKFDMYNLKTVAEIRAGINTRNLAVSGDGRYVMVGNYLPHTL
ncbi:MAG TPA: cytochrome C oxidase Cbb3, partial [Gammaproteobacteria bacterium]|nr:cytochrome C oxidase Cbb3 [Gammaproteobacteria bacterium]